MSIPLLHHHVVSAESGEALRRLYVLHGFLGQGRNFYSLAKALVQQCAGLEVVLVDLRQHGHSQGFPPPHTLTSAAEDVRRLAVALGKPITAVAGHSFGGKVALELARLLPEVALNVLVLDSTPFPLASGRGAAVLLEQLKSLPMPQPSRGAVIKRLEAHGVPPMVSAWVVTNLAPQGQSFSWRLHFPALEELLEAFRVADFTPLLTDPPPGLKLHFILAEHTDMLTEEGMARLFRAPWPLVTVHTLPNAGHWLHVDNPDGLLSLMKELL